jgi:hypothetical protein
VWSAVNKHNYLEIHCIMYSVCTEGQKLSCLNDFEDFVISKPLILPRADHQSSFTLTVSTIMSHCHIKYQHDIAIGQVLLIYVKKLLVSF